MLKLNGKLFRFTRDREETYIYDIQNNFWKKADTLNPFPSAFQGLFKGFDFSEV